MDPVWREALAHQLGAAVAMLEQALRACPDELLSVRVWDDPYAELWNVAYHALFWFDLHLFGSQAGFAPPAPFTLDELDPRGLLPDRRYSREELLGYAAQLREKAHIVAARLTDPRAAERCVFPWGELSYGELLLYAMRHMQEHAAQIALVLGQRTGAEPGWVARG